LRASSTTVYNRRLGASGYWDKGTKGYGHDIFAKEKAEALQQVLPQVAIRMNTCMEAGGQWGPGRFRSLLHMALWGNQGDSSLFTVAEMGAKGGADMQNSRLLVDDTDLIFNHLDLTLDAAVSEVHMFNDNSGMEIVSDLALVHYLLNSGKVAKVVMHLKPYPFFVSDAVPADIDHTLSVLAASLDATQQKVAADLRGFLESGRLALTNSGPINNFLASPEPMWCMSPQVRSHLSDPKVIHSTHMYIYIYTYVYMYTCIHVCICVYIYIRKVALVICKGDLMYRKLLGDRTWNTVEKFPDILSYFPSPVVALRIWPSA
jgi:hypothetical protein